MKSIDKNLLQAPGNSRKSRSYARVAGRLLIGLLIIAFLVWQTDLASIGNALTQVNPRWLALAFLVQLIGKIVWSTRWRLLLGIFGVRISFWRVLKGIFVGLFFGNFLPTSVGGDLYRSFWVVDEQQTYSRSLFVVFIERFIGVVSLGYVALPAFLFLAAQPQNSRQFTTVFLTSLGVMCLGFVALSPGVFDAVNKAINQVGISWPQKKRENISNALHTLADEKREKWYAFALSFALHIIGVLFYFCLARGLGLTWPTPYFFVIIPLTVIATMLPISMNGLGVREASLLFFSNALGANTTSTEAIALGLLALGVQLTVSVPGALFFIQGRRDDVYAHEGVNAPSD